MSAPFHLRARGIVSTASLGFVDAVLRSLEAQRAFVVLSSQDKSRQPAGLQIDDVVDAAGGHGWYRGRYFPSNDQAIAQVSFTSGTTGTPKGIALTHAALADTVARLNEVMGLDGSVREYVGVPPNYSFGIGRFRACAAVGGMCFLPERGFDPSEIRRMLADGEINALSAVPTLLRLIIARPEVIGASGRELRWMEIGSQYLSRTEKEQLKALFPNARIVQHYGLTEASRTTFLDISATEGAALESVGKPTGSVEVSTAPDHRIRIRGPHVARWAVTADGLIELTDAEGWLTTNDIGRLDAAGYLYFEGRADDLINCGGVKVVPDLVEQQLRERLPDWRGKFAVARVPDAQRGDGIFIACERSDEPALGVMRQAAEGLFAERGLQLGSALHVQAVDVLPTTDTGKVRRQSVAELLVPPTPGARESQGGERAGSVLAAFQEVFPAKSVTPRDSFFDLGGDSLGFLSLSILLEESFGRLPEGWEKMPIQALQGRLQATGATARRFGLFSLREVNSEIVLRALATLMIVAHHVWQSGVGAGVDILLMLAGLSIARVQRGKLLSSARWDIVRDTALKIVLPYYLILLAYALRHGPSALSLPEWLLLSNFEGRSGTLLTPYWFIEAFLQTMIVIVLLASIPRVRQRIESDPASFGWVALGAAIAIKALAMIAFGHTHLLNRTPDQFLYLVATGWCIYFATTVRARLTLVAVAAVAALLESGIGPGWWQGFGGANRGPILVLAVVVLLFWPTLRIPGIVRSLAIQVSLASFAIYLSHSIIVTRLWGVLPPVVSLILLVAIGIALSKLLGSFGGLRRRISTAFGRTAGTH